MIKDYSHRCAGKGGGRKAERHAGSSGNGRLQKIIGTVIIVIMVVGLCLGFWMEQEIRHGLQELSQGNREQKELSQLQEGLLQERNNLMSRQRIEVVAMQYGLYQPTAKQMLRP